MTYFFDEAVCGCHLETHHPMKPQRLLLANSLVLHYGLYRHMDVRFHFNSNKTSIFLQIMKPVLADEDDLCQFHTPDYISFLKNVIPDIDVRKFFCFGKFIKFRILKQWLALWRNINFKPIVHCFQTITNTAKLLNAHFSF